MTKKIIAIVVSVALILASFFGLQKLVQPKYLYNSVPEGSLIEEYYSQSHDNQIVFIGDCECYENISPVKLYTKYGFTSTIRGSAQQLIWQSYYLMKDTLKYEKPKVFVFNVLSMKYSEPQSEAYNRLNIEGMRWSKAKWDCIQASMTDSESVMDYILPILRYHQRWSELTADDYKYVFSKKPTLSHRGFLMRVDKKAVKKIPAAKPLTDYKFSDNTYNYLNKMVKLCEENHIKLMLIKAPSLYPAWYEEWDAQIKDYAEKNNLYYVNFLNRQKKIKLNWKKDTYDSGLHLNLSGAEKMAVYFGKLVKKKYKLKSQKKKEAVAAAWKPVVEYYKWMKKDQKAELKKYGYLKSYGAAEPKKTTKKKTTKKKTSSKKKTTSKKKSS